MPQNTVVRPPANTPKPTRAALFATTGTVGVPTHMMHRPIIPKRLRGVAFQQHGVCAPVERPTDRTGHPVGWETVPVQVVFPGFVTMPVREQRV